MKEDFLHYCWQYGRFRQLPLKLVDGSEISIISPGVHNKNAGPDFLNARLCFNGMEWVGNVEIHIRSSDWQRHGHDRDPAYDNVILHLVLIHDGGALNSKGRRLETVELGDNIPSPLFQNYDQLVKSKNWLPCASQLHRIRSVILTQVIDEMIVERLMHKSDWIKTILAKYHGDWESCCWEILCANFGFKVNAEPFRRLAMSLPINIWRKHRQDKHQLSALVFGQSGLIPSQPKDDYCSDLSKEYSILKAKYGLKALKAEDWSYFRLRPMNFPEKRMAQLTSFMYNHHSLLHLFVDAVSPDEIEQALVSEVEPYWELHYRFGKAAKHHPARMGRSSAYLLIINTVIPFIFVYADASGRDFLKKKALRWLEEMEAEDNHIIRGWQKLNIPVPNAYMAQALIQLKQNHCGVKRCLDCAAGHEILK